MGLEPLTLDSEDECRTTKLKLQGSFRQKNELVFFIAHLHYDVIFALLVRLKMPPSS